MADSKKMHIVMKNDLYTELDDYCGLHGLQKSDFIRNAVIDKLHRKSIEENLQVEVKTGDLENKVKLIEETLNEKISQLQDISLGLQERINYRLDQQGKMLQTVLNFIVLLNPTAEVKESIAKLDDSLETRILSLLSAKPKKEFDLAADLDVTIDELRESLDNLVKGNKITKNQWGYKL